MKKLFLIVLLCTAIIFTSTSCTLLWSALEPTNHWVLCSVGINIPGILFDTPMRNRFMAALIAFVINYACYFAEISIFYPNPLL